MNRTIYYNYINKKLMSLMYEIKTNSKNNLLDLNIHSENFFNYLLNIVYGYNLINALCLDWLYLIDVAKINERDEVVLCSSET